MISEGTTANLAGAIRCAPEPDVAAAVRAAPDAAIASAVRAMRDEDVYRFARALPNAALVELAHRYLVGEKQQPQTVAENVAGIEAADLAERPDATEDVIKVDVLCELHTRPFGTTSARLAQVLGRKKPIIEAACSALLAEGKVLKDGERWMKPPSAPPVVRRRVVADGYDARTAKVHPAALRLPAKPPGRVGV